ncbi:hypothetical protein COLSTE_01263 [Collinsella stercoris DSM 13279]|uniref:Uncharacterized protein n=1 Tax=Collinsella stercoris DSM 13279 TaxID=445975 RepID=B6GB10_9ACTN|nr:hypothetical protein COLSTE_01263 [Collinsella stercoris DSM 13279]
MPSSSSHSKELSNGSISTSKDFQVPAIDANAGAHLRVTRPRLIPARTPD